MDTAELIERLRLEGGFRLLPLLSTTGQVAGVHLTRFLPDGYLDVVQAWDDQWATWTRLPDDPNRDSPLVGPQAASIQVGTFAEVTYTLLPLQRGARHALDQDDSDIAVEGDDG